MERRNFLVRSAATLSAGVLGGCAPTASSGIDGPADPAPHPGPQPAPRARSTQDRTQWEDIRAEFPLTDEYRHFATFFLTSHPTPVRQAIDHHRAQLDRDPFGYYTRNNGPLKAAALRDIAAYLDVRPGEIALTDSTTMGLGIVYGGLVLSEGQEILTTDHDHTSTHRSLRFRAQRTGSNLRSIRLYKDSAKATEDGIVSAIAAAVTPRTRVIALTWVHSVTGVKIPVRGIADAVADLNKNRDQGDRALLCIDGVHGLGIEDQSLPDLGCDFFMAGAHKWMFGPRGTGLVWAKADAWPATSPTIPDFEFLNTPAALMTPGGFKPFEHRWAMGEAFKFHTRIGKSQIAQRIHSLNTMLKEGMAQMKHLRLHTPLSPSLSSGIVCFEVAGMSTKQAIDRLLERKIIGSVSPYASRYARLAPSLLTMEDDVEAALTELRAMG